MIRAQSFSTNDDSLSLASFGAVADAVIYSDGSTNYTTATDNSAALLAAMTAAASTKRKLIIPAGDFMFRTPITLVAADGLRIEGAGEDSNLIYVNSLNQNGIALGSGTSGVNFVDPTASVLSLHSDVTQATRRIRVSTSAPGETATQRLSKGMHLYLADPNQPMPYRAAANGIAQYVACFAVIEAVVDDNYVDLTGILEYDMGAGTKIGYWPDPVENVHIEKLRFTQDLVNSFRTGGSACLALRGCLDPRLYDLTFWRGTVRGLWLARSRGGDLDLIRGRETAGSGEGAAGSLMTASTQVGHLTIRRLHTDGGTHGVDFGGGKMTPALHCSVDGVYGRNAGGSVIGSHASARHLKFTNIDISCVDNGWNVDDDPSSDEGERATTITMRGANTDVSNAVVSNAPIAYRCHVQGLNSFTNIKAINCGRGMLVQNADSVTVRNMENTNTTWTGIDISVDVGPNQGFDYIRNLEFDDIRSTGTPPPLGDISLRLGGQYTMELTRELGWSFQRARRNGQPAVFVGLGAAAGQFPAFNTSPSANAADQLYGPSYSIAPVTGATSALIASTAAVTSNYNGGDVYEVSGGTSTTKTLVRIETITIGDIDLSYAGLNHAPGDVLALEGGDPITRATVRVDAVDGNGAILPAPAGWTLLSGGEYRSAPTTFGQYSTTGAGFTSTVTAVSVVNGGRDHVVGDILTVASGSVVYVAGVPQWPHIEVLTVDSTGRVLTGQLVSYAGIPAGGSFYAIAPSLALDQRDTTGDGTFTRWSIDAYDASEAQFDNATLLPVTASVSRAGVYTVTPSAPQAHGDSTNGGTGAGATFTVAYDTVLDVGQSPKIRVLAANSGSSTIASLGPRRGVHRTITFAGAKTLTDSATFVLNNGGSNIVTEAGGILDVWSDFSVPVIWTGRYSKPGGTALRQAIVGAPASASASGTAGEVRIASGYAYFCVATDTWQRVAIATWP